MVDNVDVPCTQYLAWWNASGVDFLPLSARVGGAWGEIFPTFILHDPGCGELFPWMRAGGVGIGVWQWWTGDVSAIAAVIADVRALSGAAVIKRSAEPAPSAAAAAVTAAAAAAAAVASAGSASCLLYIPASLAGFGFGALLPSGAVVSLWNTTDGWAAILGGAFVGVGGGRFLSQPTLASGESPLATLIVAAGGTSAAIAYAPLSPVPGHEALGAPAVLALASDGAAAGGASALALLSSSDGAFSYYAAARLRLDNASGGGGGAVPSELLRDVTAEVAAMGGGLQFGEAAYDAAGGVLYLAVAAVAAGDNTSTLLRVPLADPAAPLARIPLPAGAAAVSLQWAPAAGGLAVLAQNGGAGSLAWLARRGGAWATIFAFPPGTSAPEDGVGAANAGGDALLALVLSPAGRLAATRVDATSGREVSRVQLADAVLIAVDIADCAV